MKIAGINIENKSLLIAGTICTVGIGLGYVLLQKVKVKEYEEELYNTSQTSFIQAEDLEVNLFLEHEYGNFRNTSSGASESASAYLNELPVVFFKFNENFLKFTIQSATEHFSVFKKALVIGSGAGKLPFNLTKYFCQTYVVEQSMHKVSQCYQLQNKKQVKYDFPLEGTYRTTQITVNSPLPSKRDAALQTRKGTDIIYFYDVKPLEMRRVISGDFDLVVFPNSLNTLQDPDTVLGKIHDFVRPGGILIISSDYNWTKTSTHGNGFDDGTLVDSFQWLKKILAGNFQFLEEKNIPDVIGTSLRSCILRNCHVTSWKRVSPPQGRV